MPKTVIKTTGVNNIFFHTDKKTYQIKYMKIRLNVGYLFRGFRSYYTLQPLVRLWLTLDKDAVETELTFLLAISAGDADSTARDGSD